MGQSKTSRLLADKKRRQSQPYRKLFDHIRQGCRLQSPKFSKRMVEILGYTYADFRNHMEGRMQPGMCWQDFVDAKIHIGHVKPLASFDAANILQIRQAWSLQNIEPTWPDDNMAKLKRDHEYIRSATAA